MSIANRFKGAVNGFKTANNAMGENLGRQFLKYGSQQPNPMVQDWSQLLMQDDDFYTGHGYAAINNRANKVARLGTENLKTSASEAIVQAAKKANKTVKHPYLTKIEDSLDFTDYAFWYTISTYLDLEGVFYLMAVRNSDETGSRIGEIQEFKLLSPYEVTRIRSQADTTKIEGYVEVRDGMSREIPPHMIIEIRKLNPKSRETPFGLADAAKDAQFTLKQSGDHMRNTVGRNNKFSGVVQLGENEVALDPQQLQNFKARILSKDKRGEPVFATGVGAPKWVDMQIDMRKSAPDIINEIQLNNLIAVSGNSKTMSGIEQSGTTRDTAEIQKDLFTENHAMPQVKFIIDALNLDYKRHYPTEYKANQYLIEIDNPLATDHEAELKDIEVRKQTLSLYSGLRSSGYSHDMAFKYAQGEIGLDEIGEPTEQKPVIEAAVTEITAPKDKALKTPPKETKQSISHHHDRVPAIKNALDDNDQGTLATQQGMLQNAIAGIEERLVSTVLSKVTKNQFEEQSDILSEEDREAFENELEILLAAFYAVIIPLYASTVLSRRAAEFGMSADFKLNGEVQSTIKELAKKAAVSHIATITEDLRETIQTTNEKRVNIELKAAVVDALSKIPAEEVEKILGAGNVSDLVRPENVEDLLESGKITKLLKAGETDLQKLYRFAREKALTGAGRQELIAAIRKEYSYISAERAKVIARTETNRAFTQSQFQADKQFITQNGLQGRAYKKWVTRSGNPCAICVSLAARGPIPFDLNFANLGEELSATYEEDGKTKVLKQKINYEALSSGNAHPQCACIYQLIIE